MYEVRRLHAGEDNARLTRSRLQCTIGMSSAGLGCILADEMGLGKTIQSITLIWTLLSGSLLSSFASCGPGFLTILAGGLAEQNPYYHGGFTRAGVIDRAMIVCPVTLMKVSRRLSLNEVVCCVDHLLSRFWLAELVFGVQKMARTRHSPGHGRRETQRRENFRQLENLPSFDCRLRSCALTHRSKACCGSV